MDFVSSISNKVLPKVNSLLASTITVSSSPVTASRDLVASGGSYVVSSSANDSAAQTLSLLKKALGISLAGAAFMGSAFYIGYQFAKKRHRFHVRETDKNDQVSGSILEVW